MDKFFDDLRAREFSRLDAQGQTYLDYTGAGLYAESLVCAHQEMLSGAVLGNPHSQNPASVASTHWVERARERTLRFFDADPAEHEVVFTLNASGALKLVGESFPFEPGSRFALTADNHNSVNGIREFAQARGACVDYLPVDSDLRVPDLHRFLREPDRSKPNLFAYPAQSNFSGVKHPLAWCDLAHDLGYHVLLDAAAYVPTNALSLRQTRADFVSLSYYKMFGFPTGVGALLARREALAALRRPWFGGGTVRFVSAQNKVHLLQASGEAFEDGTLNYLSIAAIPAGLDFLQGIGLARLNARVSALTGSLLAGLQTMRHSNGAPLAQVYGPHTTEARGGTISLNVLDPAGELVDSQAVELRASAQNISLRSGCFCNPGAAEFAFEYSAVEAYECFESLSPAAFTLQQFSTCMNDKPVGAVRVSVGLATSEADVHRFLDFLTTFRDQAAAPALARRVPEVVGG